MLHKLLFSSMITFIILNIFSPWKAQAGKNINKNSLINKFCVASLKSKITTKNKEYLDEISNFTCDCFFRKYKSGYSLRKSRIYCKHKASEKYNL